MFVTNSRFGSPRGGAVERLDNMTVKSSLKGVRVTVSDGPAQITQEMNFEEVNVNLP